MSRQPAPAPRQIRPVDTGPFDLSRPTYAAYVKESPQESPRSANSDRAARAAEATTSGSSAGHGRPAPSASSRSPEALATQLYDSISAGKKDMAIPILCREPPDVVAAVAAAFEAKYKTHAHRYLRERLGGADRHFVALLEALAAGPYEFAAMRLREALFGKKLTHLSTILQSDIADILAGRPFEDVRGVREAYKTLYGVELHHDIYTRLSSPYRDLMVMVVKSERRSPQNTTPKQDAQALYAAGEGMAGTNAIAFFEILTDRSDEHLLQVFDEYHRAHGKSLVDAIKSEVFGAETGRALILIIRSIINRTDTVVRLFNRALSVNSLGDIIDQWLAGGSAADDGMLVRLIVEYRAPGIREHIKRAYLETHRKPMSQRMRELIGKGDYLEALIACLGEHSTIAVQ